MPSPKDVQQARTRRIEEAAAAQARKAERRAENERNRKAKVDAQRRAALPIHERLAETAERIDAKWVIPAATVSAEQVRAAQRAAITRVEVVEVIREITVEVPAPPLPAGSYTECEVCVGRGMRDRYGQVPPAPSNCAWSTGPGRR
ncbi:hypothetical protein ACFQ0B_45045 [Nonomuraea thailandensis]